MLSSVAVLFGHSKGVSADQPTADLEATKLESERASQTPAPLSAATVSAMNLTIPDAARNQSLRLSAEAALVADLNTGQVLLAKNEHEALYPASTTKILTAIIAKRSIPFDKLVHISDYAASAEPNRMGLSAGETVSVHDLVDGMLINSGNDAARAVAEAYPTGETGFVAAMNSFVANLGLKDSHFVNSSGLHDPAHVSSVYDLAVLMRYLAATYPDLLPVLRTSEMTIPATTTHPAYQLSTLSSMLKNHPEIEAVKTGYTPDAGYTWVATVKTADRHLVIAFMRSWSSTEDANQLVNFALRVPLSNAGQ